MHIPSHTRLQILSGQLRLFIFLVLGVQIHTIYSHMCAMRALGIFDGSDDIQAMAVPQ
jgi:hypothetical protein